MNSTGGIHYATEDNGIGGRGLSTMGGVPPLTNYLPPPVQPKNGTAEAGDGSDEINAPPRADNPMLDRYAIQPIPDNYPQI